MHCLTSHAIRATHFSNLGLPLQVAHSAENHVLLGPDGDCDGSQATWNHRRTMPSMCTCEGWQRYPDGRDSYQQLVEAVTPRLSEGKMIAEDVG